LIRAGPPSGRVAGGPECVGAIPLASEYPRPDSPPATQRKAHERAVGGFRLEADDHWDTPAVIDSRWRADSADLGADT